MAILQAFSIIARKNSGVTGLKLGMQTQLDFANNIGWFPSGHTYSSVCKAKNGIYKKKKHFDLITCSPLL